MNDQSPEQLLLSELDSLIVSNRKLEAVQLLRQRRGLTLVAATEALTSRYSELRASSPGRFTCGDEQYWRGFHS